MEENVTSKCSFDKALEFYGYKQLKKKSKPKPTTEQAKEKNLNNKIQKI